MALRILMSFYSNVFLQVNVELMNTLNLQTILMITTQKNSVRYIHIR
jgi:hypothetical protein